MSTAAPSVTVADDVSAKNMAITSVPLKSRFKRYARTRVIAMLHKGIRRGQVIVYDSGEVLEFGLPEPGLSPASIIVYNQTFYWRIFLYNDLGFAESYMLGEFAISDLKLLCDIWIINAQDMVALSSLAHKLFSNVVRLSSGLYGQSLARSKLNAIAGYDASNVMFKAFLSQEMMYSCALWGPEEGGHDGDLYGDNQPCHLEAAQKRKIRYILTQAQVRRGDRVLEFGSGFCGLAIEAVQWLGCTVDSITLSIEQKKLGEERIRAAGLSDSIRVHLMDYRRLPASFENAFDAFISVEMIEHVGTRHYAKYFSVVDWALKNHNAAAVVVATTIAETRYSIYQSPDFSRYYMWPNGALPSPTAIIQGAQSGSKKRLRLEAVENHGQHYARTLREWERRFRQNIPGVESQILEENHKFQDDRKLFESFKRKWLYLFPSAAAGYASGYLGCHMLKFTRDVA